jgi:hypothetical protein
MTTCWSRCDHLAVGHLARISHWSEQKILLVVISPLCPETYSHKKEKQNADRV